MKFKSLQRGDSVFTLERDRRSMYPIFDRAKVETKVEKVETQVKTNEQVAKKRRGRPRKIVQNVDETPVQKKEKQKQHQTSGIGLLDNPLIKKGFGNTKAATASSSTPDYKTGDRVSHIKFGEGVVKDMTEHSGDYMVTVEFDNQTTRKMMASFAKLKKK